MKTSTNTNSTLPLRTGTAVQVFLFRVRAPLYTEV